MISFFVFGIPSPGGSKSGFPIKKFGVYTGRVAIVDAGGKKTKEWRKAVAAEARQHAPAELLTCPCAVHLTFNMPRPKAHFRSNGMLRDAAPLQHTQKPDALKLARSTEDAMTGVIWYDDSATTELSVRKVWADGLPGCSVQIIPALTYPLLP